MKNKELNAGIEFDILPGMDSLKDKIHEMEKEEILNALKECNWVMAQAARNLGITERMIGYKMKKYGIRREVAGHDPGRRMG